MMYLVRKVRRETVWVNGVAHEHIVGVVTSSGIYYDNERVASSIAAGDEWLVDARDGPRARIEVVSYCPFGDCDHGPYLCVQSDRADRDMLESLPPG
jgi:hypothetical protein